jgi:hypothetical protein
MMFDDVVYELTSQWQWFNDYLLSTIYYLNLSVGEIIYIVCILYVIYRAARNTLLEKSGVCKYAYSTYPYPNTRILEARNLKTQKKLP